MMNVEDMAKSIEFNYVEDDVLRGVELAHERNRRHKRHLFGVVCLMRLMRPFCLLVPESQD